MPGDFLLRTIIGKWTASRLPSLFFMVIVISMLAGPWAGTLHAGAEDTECPPADYSIGSTTFHQIIMDQGNDPDTPQTEARELLSVVDRSYWEIPWDSDEVYVSMPDEAQSIIVEQVEGIPHQGQSIFVPGKYSAMQNPEDPPEKGRVTEGDYEGFYYWRFPEHADRSENDSMDVDTDEDFADYDPQLTDPDDFIFSFGSIGLAQNVTEATWTSKMFSGGADLTEIGLSYWGFEMDNMTFEVTGDNGTTWHPAEPSTTSPVPEIGSEFRWRVTMTQVLADNATPFLDWVTLVIHFLPYTTDTWIEASYLMEIPKEGLGFDIMFPFDVDVSGLIYLGSFDHDMEVNVTGVHLVRNPGDTHEEKVTYTFMSGPYECKLTFFIKDHQAPGENDEFPWLLYLLPLVIVIVIALAYYWAKSSGEREIKDLEEADDDDEEEEEGLDDMGLEELETRKAELLANIKQVRKDHEEGIVGDEELDVRINAYKDEAVQVMKRIDSYEDD